MLLASFRPMDVCETTMFGLINRNGDVLRWAAFYWIAILGPGLLSFGHVVLPFLEG